MSARIIRSGLVCLMLVMTAASCARHSIPPIQRGITSIEVDMDERAAQKLRETGRFGSGSGMRGPLYVIRDSTQIDSVVRFINAHRSGWRRPAFTPPSWHLGVIMHARTTDGRDSVVSYFGACGDCFGYTLRATPENEDWFKFVGRQKRLDFAGVLGLTVEDYSIITGDTLRAVGKATKKK